MEPARRLAPFSVAASPSVAHHGREGGCSRKVSMVNALSLGIDASSSDVIGALGSAPFSTAVCSARNAWAQLGWAWAIESIEHSSAAV